MQIFIMRHGEAALDSTNDAARRLTIFGRHESRMMGAWLSTKSVNIEKILISPYIRAQETLAMIRETMALPEAQLVPELTPTSKTIHVINYLHKQVVEGVNYMLIISHAPVVRCLVKDLCLGKRLPILVTASIVNVILESSGSGKFAWQMSPSQLTTVV